MRTILGTVKFTKTFLYDLTHTNLTYISKKLVICTDKELKDLHQRKIHAKGNFLKITDINQKRHLQREICPYAGKLEYQGITL